ncbi:hypothetical protein JCM8547_001634 [Rhodosporidiobolus lusitaniae]
MASSTSTHGAQGEQPLLNQATHLAGASLDYAKGLVGLGKDAGAKDSQDAKQGEHCAEGKHTLGELISEGRNLTANIIHEASTVIAGAADKTKDAANDASRSADSGKPQGYVEKARSAAASVLSQAEGLIAAGEKKAEEAGDELKKQGDDLKKQADAQKDKLDQQLKEAKETSSSSASGYAEAVKTNVGGESSAQDGSALNKTLHG